MIFIIAIAVAFLVAFLICNGCKNAMSNVAIKQEAADYVSKNEINIKIRTDQYTHSSVSRRQINK